MYPFKTYSHGRVKSVRVPRDRLSDLKGRWTTVTRPEETRSLGRMWVFPKSFITARSTGARIIPLRRMLVVRRGVAHTTDRKHQCSIMIWIYSTWWCHRGDASEQLESAAVLLSRKPWYSNDCRLNVDMCVFAFRRALGNCCFHSRRRRVTTIDQASHQRINLNWFDNSTAASPWRWLWHCYFWIL